MRPDCFSKIPSSTLASCSSLASSSCSSSSLSPDNSVPCVLSSNLPSISLKQSSWQLSLLSPQLSSLGLLPSNSLRLISHLHSPFVIFSTVNCYSLLAHPLILTQRTHPLLIGVVDLMFSPFRWSLLCTSLQLFFVLPYISRCITRLPCPLHFTSSSTLVSLVSSQFSQPSYLRSANSTTGLRLSDPSSRVSCLQTNELLEDLKDFSGLQEPYASLVFLLIVVLLLGAFVLQWLIPPPGDCKCTPDPTLSSHPVVIRSLSTSPASDV
jgi:hypothetical protein